MSGATWRPIPVNFTANGQEAVYGVVVHIMAGTLAGTDSWFRNSKAQASSHFGTGKAGALYQWVDTKDRAWAQASGNRTWISVENEGQGGDVLTDAQLQRVAEVLAWAHKVHGVPLQVASSPSGRGLGYHAMGGAAWGGHTSCPGTKIVAQLPEIVRRAKALTGQTPDKPSAPAPAKPVVDLSKLISAAKTDPRAAQGHTTYAAGVRIVEAALKAEGLLSARYAGDGSFGSVTVQAYAAWQRSKAGGSYRGASADGIPGLSSLRKLAARHGFTVTA
ncbi:N-acetylmuramoyl-L-alanine amidase [Streptomyces sp. NPDC015414]|uniref:N-acetylmuramoyl-L-alanine amidase n=1 Tax=Streptomyces sp. NPDC015414 TaxID=3364957 RepID=UPI0037012D03